MSTGYILKRFILLWLGISCLFMGIRIFSIKIIRKETYNLTYSELFMVFGITAVLMFLQYLRMREITRKGVK
jgi:uncharacterized membrane protein